MMQRFISVCMLFLATMVLPTSISAKESKGKQPADSVYIMADKMPEFPGGERALLRYLGDKIKYPSQGGKANEPGKVVVRLVVNKKGKVSEVSVMKGLSPAFDKEAIRVVKSMPAWIPGEQNGQKVSVSTILPVQFRNYNDSSQWEPTSKTLVVLDSVIMPSYFTSEILNPDKITSLVVRKPFPAETKKQLMKQYGKQAANGVLLITTNRDGMYYATSDSVTIRQQTLAGCNEKVVWPAFPGGKTQMFRFITDSIQYPFVSKQTKREGKVQVSFLVDKTGKISNARIVQPVEYFLEKEALRVISLMPRWIPANKCGQALDAYVSLPVNFKLPVEEKKWERSQKTLVLLNGKRLPASFDLNLITYINLSSYRVLEPKDKKTIRHLRSKYGKGAENGVILISTEFGSK